MFRSLILCDFSVGTWHTLKVGQFQVCDLPCIPFDELLVLGNELCYARCISFMILIKLGFLMAKSGGLIFHDSLVIDLI